MKTLKRRKREHKTDYGIRLKLLKSGKARVVFRKTNKYVLAQYISSIHAQDKIVFEASSKELLKHGWPKEAAGSLKNISASYLTGLLIGKKIEKAKVEKPIIDFGMLRVLHKSKLYAFIKGVTDAGVEISCNEEAFPSDNRIQGKHLKKQIPFDQIKSSVEKI